MRESSWMSILPNVLEVWEVFWALECPLSRSWYHKLQLLGSLGEKKILLDSDFIEEKDRLSQETKVAYVYNCITIYLIYIYVLTWKLNLFLNKPLIPTQVKKVATQDVWEWWDSTLLWLHAASIEVQIRRNLVLQRLEFLGPQGPLSVKNRKVGRLHKAILLDGATCGVWKISWGFAALQIEGQPITCRFRHRVHLIRDDWRSF